MRDSGSAVSPKTFATSESGAVDVLDDVYSRHLNPVGLTSDGSAKVGWLDGVLITRHQPDRGVAMRLRLGL